MPIFNYDGVLALITTPKCEAGTGMIWHCQCANIPSLHEVWNPWPTYETDQIVRLGNPNVYGHAPRVISICGPAPATWKRAFADAQFAEQTIKSCEGDTMQLPHQWGSQEAWDYINDFC